MLFKIKGTSKRQEYHDAIIQDVTTKEYRFEFNPDEGSYSVYQLDKNREIVQRLNLTVSYNDLKEKLNDGHWKLKGKFNDQGKN